MKRACMLLLASTTLSTAQAQIRPILNPKPELIKLGSLQLEIVRVKTSNPIGDCANSDDGGGGGGEIDPVPPSVPAGLQLQPRGHAHPLGSYLHIRAYLVRNKHRVNVTDNMQWSSSDPRMLPAKGFYTTPEEAYAELQLNFENDFKLQGVLGRQASNAKHSMPISLRSQFAHARIDVLPRALEDLYIDACATVGVSESAPVRVMAVYSNGVELASGPDLSAKITDPSIAELQPVRALDKQFVLVGKTVGKTELIASYGGFVKSAPVEVRPARMISFRIDPASLSLPVGRSGNFSVIGQMSDGSEKPVSAGEFFFDHGPGLRITAGDPVSTVVGERAGNYQVGVFHKRSGRQALLTVEVTDETAGKIQTSLAPEITLAPGQRVDGRIFVRRASGELVLLSAAQFTATSSDAKIAQVARFDGRIQIAASPMAAAGQSALITLRALDPAIGIVQIRVNIAR